MSRRRHHTHAHKHLQPLALHGRKFAHEHSMRPHPDARKHFPLLALRCAHIPCKHVHPLALQSARSVPINTLCAAASMRGQVQPCQPCAASTS